jgi:hypothetical protein
VTGFKTELGRTFGGTRTLGNLPEGQNDGSTIVASSTSATGSFQSLWGIKAQTTELTEL